MNVQLMLDRIRGFRQLFLFFPVVWGVASCTVGGEAPIGEDAGTSSSSSGAGGGDPGPCGVDCSQFETPQCMVAVCNTGQELGPLNTCVVVPAPKGTSCDDGKFCTVNDVCDNGTCGGGSQNLCGLKPDPCSSVICYEELQTCDVTPVGDGAPCTPTDLCQIKGVCKIGECVGEPRDCDFSPLSECNTMSCDPATGDCVPTPDPAKDNKSCVLTGDLCKVNRTCQAGQCAGGEPRDCSGLDVECKRGVCNPENGTCVSAPAPAGTTCTEGVAECHVGKCDAASGNCLSTSAPDGSACNDYNSCTTADTCSSGACVAGDSVDTCVVYLHEGFENCSNGWTFGGDWECGTPSNVGPPVAHIGDNVIATQIAGLYHTNQSYSTSVATSPAIDLTGATNPMVSFWAWDHTEGGTFDGWNLKVSTNGGQSFTQVTTVTPAYGLNIAGQPAWGGNHAAEGWQNYMADLTAFAGQSILLRFSFRSDGATVFPGVYVDELVVAEPQQIPMYITSTSPLQDVYAGMSYATTITRVGGSSNALWSIKPGGQNTAWLTIDPVTGVLAGTPSAAEDGPVTVTVHVEEPMLPSNYAEKTFTFNVKPNSYYTSFEGTCPDGWTLTGDWECGVPVNVGPATAYQGTQCIATKLGENYSISQTFAGTTATSPDIDLTSAQSPTLTFRMWIDTEGSTYDGVTLQVSTDGGMSYATINGVSPAYPLTIAGKPAWGGHQSGLGWQFMQADLSPYVGKIVRLRFAFQSDTSGTFPGVYIDDIFID
ncbi:immune inhibitor A domain-containing protein [Polyangium aurulentum]|uniref:immune inhibitor A domain-containing protein n=1 Tax=Polyangium aurulentum TaxID=2567896 RepID=UPI0010AE0670|nr:immune inhibitor A domain-containing protein [Polyangium aurulentum]UQA60574.1 immune inhibitor A [Polyangium aurulentum]